MSEGNGTAIAVRTEQPEERLSVTQTYEPTTMQEALTLARVLVNSRLLPRAVTTPEQAFTIILAGKELGFTAMQSLRGIHVIEGKPSLSADAILALVQRSQQCEYFRLLKSDAVVATYETLRRGYPEAIRLSFTMEEAKAAGLTSKDNWRKYPAAMLRARCITALGRAVYADLVMGVYEYDELPQPEERQAQRGPVRGKLTDAGAVIETSADEDLGEKLGSTVAAALIARLEEGFVNWNEKRAWAEDNKAAKAALPPEDQARVTEAFKKAHPTRKTPEPEPKSVPATTGEPTDEEIAEAQAREAEEARAQRG